MSKALKWFFLALVLVAFAGVVSHGVVLPRFVWEHQLKQVEAQFPDHSIEVQRVVLALSLDPALMLSGVSVQHPVRQEHLQIGLLRLGFDGLSSVQQGRLQLQHIGVKGLQANAQRQTDCLANLHHCIPRLPWTFSSRLLMQHAHISLRTLEVEQAEFRVESPLAQQTLTGRIDHARYVLNQNNHPNALSLGWRLQVKAPGVDNALTAALTATPESAFKFNQIAVQVDGQWGGFPWTASLAQDQLAFEFAQAGGRGAPLLMLSGQNLRTYLRRNDAPETHQAAFSARRVEGGLPAQPWRMQEAEWTYTHEDAQAWTFNLVYTPAEQQLNIEPAHIAGSEGLPAAAQHRTLGCPPSPGRTAASPVAYWVWQAGWFRVYNTLPAEPDLLVLCPANPS